MVFPDPLDHQVQKDSQESAVLREKLELSAAQETQDRLEPLDKMVSLVFVVPVVNKVKLVFLVNLDQQVAQDFKVHPDLLELPEKSASPAKLDPREFVVTPELPDATETMAPKDSLVFPDRKEHVVKMESQAL